MAKGLPSNLKLAADRWIRDVMEQAVENMRDAADDTLHTFTTRAELATEDGTELTATHIDHMNAELWTELFDVLERTVKDAIPSAPLETEGGELYMRLDTGSLKAKSGLEPFDLSSNGQVEVIVPPDAIFAGVFLVSDSLAEDAAQASYDKRLSIRMGVF